MEDEAQYLLILCFIYFKLIRKLIKLMMIIGDYQNYDESSTVFTVQSYSKKKTNKQTQKKKNNEEDK